MKSEWRVTSNKINGKMMYAAYRLIDDAGVDHSGNREYAGGYIESESLANAAANALNPICFSKQGQRIYSSGTRISFQGTSPWMTRKAIEGFVSMTKAGR